MADGIGEVLGKWLQTEENDEGVQDSIFGILDEPKANSSFSKKL